MAAMSRGTIERPYKVAKNYAVSKNKKTGTASTNKHRFESFSHRIAKLNIDPVRKSRRHDLDKDTISSTASYFRNSFNEWTDRNLSENFTSFVYKVHPLSETLPQILHNEKDIINLLLLYIEKGDALSLEPLLGLVAHFAHDLGVRFEKYFERTVLTVSQLAAAHTNVEVIEWSFTCLAWLFKYLSRLLVPDLRPLYKLMAPLLGKTPQKPFISRFAAESLSFLVRKAGTIYHRDNNPLQNVIRCSLVDVNSSEAVANTIQYEQGLMTLFVESIKGVNGGIHSSGEVILREILTHVLSSSNSVHCTERQPAERVLVGILIAITHHTEAATFPPIYRAVMEETAFEMDSSLSRKQQRLFAKLLLVLAGSRRGSRIQDWAGLTNRIASLVHFIDRTPGSVDVDTILETLLALAVLFQQSPLDVAISNIRVLQTISSGIWQSYFLPFCAIFGELGIERFRTLLQGQFQKFIKSHWETDEKQFCLLLPKLSSSGCLVSLSLKCPEPWQSRLEENFSKMCNVLGGAKYPCRVASFNGLALEDSSFEDLMSLCNGYFDILQLFELLPDVRKAILTSVSNAFKVVTDREREEMVKAEEGISRSPSRFSRFKFGRLFKFLVEQQTQIQEPGDTNVKLGRLDTWQTVFWRSGTCGDMVVFWEAMAIYIRALPSFDFENTQSKQLLGFLIEGLASPEHDIRLHTIEVLQTVYRSAKDARSDAISTALLIATTPITLQSARSVSMHIRRLSSLYGHICTDGWLSKAIPAFLFGLLYIKFSQVWDDCCTALKEICDSKEGEEAVSRIAFEWITRQPHIDQSNLSVNQFHDLATQHITDFECTNLNRLASLSKQATEGMADSSYKLMEKFINDHRPVTQPTALSRGQALRVLNSVPQVAEKRSRQLVPILLQWASGAEDGINQSWTHTDRKAILSLFGQFMNPKVLYRSTEVYQALLSLLCNGDVEIQKLALKAILTWKNMNVNRYEENLMNILDDERFREQITVFLHIGQDDSTLQEEDQETVMPVLLRIFYGRITARSGSAKGNQQSRRKAVFIALSRFGERTLGNFLEIAFGPLKTHVIDDLQGDYNKEVLTLRKQFGLLNMLEDMFDTLGTQLTPFAPQLMRATLYCSVRAARSLSSSPIENILDVQGHQLSLLRSVRQVGLRCLNYLFASCPDYTWEPFLPDIYQELVNPRLEDMPIETAQSVSGILRLFSTWAKSIHTVHFLSKFNRRVLLKIAECLEVPSAKDNVRIFVLDIAKSIVRTAEELPQSPHAAQMLNENAQILLGTIGNVLHGNPCKDVLENGIETLALLSPFASGPSTKNMVEISLFLLKQPPKRVGLKRKADILRILHRFIPQLDYTVDRDRKLIDETFEIISSLFSFVQDKVSRALLSEIITGISLSRPELSSVAELCHSLNSFSERRLDEPDFDRRQQAYAQINDDEWSTLSVHQWRPLISNMLFYIRDNDELIIRENSALSLRRFVEAASNECNPDLEYFKDLISSILLPGLRYGLRESSELVRSAFLSVLGHLVKCFSTWSLVSDMHDLLVGGDEEASFFNNVLHIQQQRRIRALRRLADVATKGNLHCRNINQIFIPLIEHFIFDRAEGESAHNLAAEAVATIGVLAQWLDWPQYRVLLKRFSDSIQSRSEEVDKNATRLFSVVVHALHEAGRSKGYIKERLDIYAQEEPPSSETSKSQEACSTTLSRTLPAYEKLAADLKDNFIAHLTQYIHYKDENTVSLRVPVAAIVVKLVQLLSPQEFALHLPPLLMDVCHILRSRADTSRDLARKTLAEISVLIGPKYFGYVLKELRRALQRGYQLHVLSFTMHSILVYLSEKERMDLGDLDYCLQDIVAVVMDDIFGATGQEKDAAEYTNKMKEVKSSKSFDSMELVTKITSPTYFAILIKPIQALLRENLTQKMVNRMDELLRRVRLGILHNPSSRSKDVLIFCYELLQEEHKLTSKLPPSQTSYAYKVTCFGLQLLRAVLRKHESLQTPANLDGFMSFIGDALVTKHQEEIQMSATGLLSTIIKVQLPRIDSDAPVYAAEALRTVHNAHSTSTELAQASLKLVAAILRERKAVTVPEKPLGRVIQKIKDDLEEPDRQGVAFNFLKAVMSRKIVIPEIYEVLDKVASIMITNHDRLVRDLARGAYIQFLMEYPQAKGRLSKQLEFLVTNVNYKHIEGRQSVLEAWNILLNKVGDGLIQEIVQTGFMPFVWVMWKDESNDCQKMASLLLKKVFEKADRENLKSFCVQMERWIEEEKIGTKCLGLLCWKMFFEVMASQEQEPKKSIAFFLDRFPGLIQIDIARDVGETWELLFRAQEALEAVCKLSRSAAFADSTAPVWETIRRCLAFPHAWVKSSAAKVLGLYLADFARNSATAGLRELPLLGSGGLKLTEEIQREIARSCLKVLKTSELQEWLAKPIAANLLFLGRCFAVNNLPWMSSTTDERSEQEFKGFSDTEEAGGKANDGDGVDEDEFESTSHSALSHLLYAASKILRRDVPTRTAAALTPKQTCVSLLTALIPHVPPETLNSSLSALILPLYQLTSATTSAPRSSHPTSSTDYHLAQQSLFEGAGGLMDVIRGIVGQKAWLDLLGGVERKLRERREERRIKRRVEAVVEPDKAERAKRRKRERGKERRKEKSMEMRGRRRGW